MKQKAKSKPENVDAQRSAVSSTEGLEHGEVYMKCCNAAVRFEVSSEDAINALLDLAARRYDERAWGMVRLVLEYDHETTDEKENIERTLIEMLRNESVL